MRSEMVPQILVAPQKAGGSRGLAGRSTGGGRERARQGQRLGSPRGSFTDSCREGVGAGGFPGASQVLEGLGAFSPAAQGPGGSGSQLRSKPFLPPCPLLSPPAPVVAKIRPLCPQPRVLVVGPSRPGPALCFGLGCTLESGSSRPPRVLSCGLGPTSKPAPTAQTLPRQLGPRSRGPGTRFSSKHACPAVVFAPSSARLPLAAHCPDGKSLSPLGLGTRTVFSPLTQPFLIKISSYPRLHLSFRKLVCN